MGGGFGDSQPYEPPLCKGRWLPVGQTEGLYVTITAKYNPSVSYADSSPCTGEPLLVAFTAADLLNPWQQLAFLAVGACQLEVRDAAKPTSAATSRPAPRR